MFVKEKSKEKYLSVNTISNLTINTYSTIYLIFKKRIYFSTAYLQFTFH